VKRALIHFSGIAILLAVIAAGAPPPVSDDRGVYVDIGRQLPLPDCSNLHCARFLVATVVEHLPGPSLFKWKAYAVLANAGAAVAVGQFSLAVGLSEESWALAAWLSALGSGSLYTLFDCYTSDPLMYLIGPALSIVLLKGNIFRAGLLSALAVFAKEFAAVPLWMFTIVAIFKRKWRQVREMLLSATTVTLLWLAEQAVLFAFYNYGYGTIRSTDIWHGGYFSFWMSSVGTIGAMKYLFIAFGALYLLLPVGWSCSPEQLRALALAAVPAVVVFVYVQQPERALWNYHFIVIPIAVAALGAVPAWASWLFVASFGVANLRFGAQMQTGYAGRLATVMTVLVALVVNWRTLARRRASTHAVERRV
jgi:hypothetical protein